MIIDKQNITELAALTNQKLLAYYESIKDRYHKETFENFVNDLFDRYFTNFPTDAEVQNLYVHLRDNHNQHRRRWCGMFEKDFKNLDLQNPKSAFHFLLDFSEHLHPDQFFKLYQASTAPDAANCLMLDIRAWKKKKGYLIDFPAFNNVILRKSKLYYLAEDVMLDITRHLVTNFGGNINALLLQKPYDLVEHNIYASSNVKITNKGGVLINTENRFLQYISNTDLLPTVAFGLEDSNLVDVIGQMLEIDFIAKKVSNLTIPLRKLTAIYKHTSRPSVQQCQEVKNRLNSLASNHIRLVDGDTDLGTIRVLSNVSFSDDAVKPVEEQTAVIAVGTLIANNRINNLVIKLPSSKYYSLESNLAKCIYSKMQLDRLSLYVRTKRYSETINYNYSYIFFCDNYILTDRKSRVIKKIIDMLEEFKSKKIMVKDYTLNTNNTTFKVTFLPLDVSEIYSLDDTNALIHKIEADQYKN